MFKFSQPAEKSTFHIKLSEAFSSGELLRFTLQKIEEIILKQAKTAKEKQIIVDGFRSLKGNVGISLEFVEMLKNILLDNLVLESISMEYFNKLDFARKNECDIIQLKKQKQVLHERLLSHLWNKVIQNRTREILSNEIQNGSDSMSLSPIIETHMLGIQGKINGILLVHEGRNGELINGELLPSLGFSNIFPDTFEHEGLLYKKVKLSNGKFTFLNLIDGTLGEEYDFIGQPHLSRNRNDDHNSLVSHTLLIGKHPVAFTAIRNRKSTELAFLYEFPHHSQKLSHQH